ncbi:Acetyltransferase (GNAT) domain-containing protein [Zobellia uliginosa]|uniref:Acetyltransferase (GNAT) domain-containing protein n=1 Tax=Zobellia uliginosa TaxID=143224 RepID=A0ABY1KP50_9FLAO|nr:GNAT family N-acetyltransferase [Zobellia uliginosa]SIS56180.1 Acetyltransferase (GNAT) domain-containing protein [Zobellia uliginosa]
MEIVPFNPSYASAFRDLNLKWIEEFFAVEPLDTYLLENCEANIIDKGGYIFFAKKENDIVGCCALLPAGPTTFELGKMAVAPNYRGHKIGQKLLSHVLDFSKQKSLDRLILYSNTKLNDALHIYKKFGFVEVPIEENLEYTRSNIKMQLTL